MKPFAGNAKSKNILRALMDPSEPDAVPWSSGELRAMLEHQLATQLEAECNSLARTSQCTVEQAREVIRSCGCLTFGDLLLNRSAPIEAVRLVKEYAKTSLTRDGDLPRDVARVLYVLSILCGRRAGAGHITSMDESSLSREISRCLTFAWLPESIRDAIRNAARAARRDRNLPKDRTE